MYSPTAEDGARSTLCATPRERGRWTATNAPNRWKSGGRSFHPTYFRAHVSASSPKILSGQNLSTNTVQKAPKKTAMARGRPKGHRHLHGRIRRRCTGGAQAHRTMKHTDSSTTPSIRRQRRVSVHSSFSSCGPCPEYCSPRDTHT